MGVNLLLCPRCALFRVAGISFPSRGTGGRGRGGGGGGGGETEVLPESVVCVEDSRPDQLLRGDVSQRAKDDGYVLQRDSPERTSPIVPEKANERQNVGYSSAERDYLDGRGSGGGAHHERRGVVAQERQPIVSSRYSCISIAQGGAALSRRQLVSFPKRKTDDATVRVNAQVLVCSKKEDLPLSSSDPLYPCLYVSFQGKWRFRARSAGGNPMRDSSQRRLMRSNPRRDVRRLAMSKPLGLLASFFLPFSKEEEARSERPDIASGRGCSRIGLRPMSIFDAVEDSK